ncbi:hypothetical protein [Candidatus Poriferisodalis sp.]|uniref:hypothetical protein n=1 Tax=Candidatus Poriferisodalis sp. TaxID=3101277 RepID=UPI003C70102A
MTTPPLDPRTRAALDAFDKRLDAEQINLRIYVASGIVAAFVFDPDEDPVDYAAAADCGDAVLATIGADIAREHDLPPDWINQINPRPDPTPRMWRRPAGRLRAFLDRMRRPTRRSS